MRFLPKSCASIDQAPGPTIAKVAPRMAIIIDIAGSPALDKLIQISTMAIKVPATGVHKPTRINIPPAAPINDGASEETCDALLNV